GHLLDQRHADARLRRCAGAGRDDDLARVHVPHLRRTHLIIATHHDLLAHLSHVLHQVEGEGVVVVEDEDQLSLPVCAISTARTSAPALLTHSSCSLSGMESATIPAPA